MLLNNYFGSPKEIVDKIPVVGSIVNFLAGENGDYGLFISIISLFLLFYGLGFTAISPAQVFTITLILAPFWLTWYLLATFHWKWMEYVGKKFQLYNGRTTLRIRIPQEITKSPEAMEFVLAQIHNPQSIDNYMQSYLDGKRPLNNSLEIVSIGGDVRLYVNLPSRKIKAAFESNLYAQYPGVEVIEEPVDYAAEIPLSGEGWEWMSFHLNKKADQVLPIKTYKDYGLDKMPKEEEKVDPMTPMLEIMGALGPQERLYIQIIISPHRKTSFKTGNLSFGSTSTWETKVEAKIDEMMRRDPVSKAPLGAENAAGVYVDRSPQISPGERETIEAMERNKEKYAYETGIRYIYAAKDGHFVGDRIAPINRTFSQYDLLRRNSIGIKWRTDFNYKKLSDPFNKKLPALRRQELKELKLRKYFNKIMDAEAKIFTVEELATMFHLPGSVAVTPNLSRIPSTRSEAPSNLPIGDLPT